MDIEDPLPDEIAAYPFWYHRIDLGNGTTTPGQWDLRGAAAALPWPDVQGLRCLDVGTFDGWFAFELETRGAAEVVAIDLDDPDRLDWPRDVRPGIGDSGWEAKHDGTGFALGRGFALAAAARRSSVEWRPLSIYDLDPDEIGTFDVVTCGSLLLHLRDPIRALEAVRSVCAGVFLSSEAVDVRLSVFRRGTPAARLNGLGSECQWWVPNAAGHNRMLRSAGFEIVDTAPPYVLTYHEKRPPTLRDRRNIVEAALTAGVARTTTRGLLHHGVLARPAGTPPQPGRRLRSDPVTR